MEKENEPQRPADPSAKQGSWAGILFAAVICFAVYLVLSFLTLNFFGPVLLVGGVLMLVVTFHYLVWGWWLGRVVRQAEDDETDDS